MVAAWLYWLGWRKLHSERPRRYPSARLISFIAGLSLVALAILSPFDAFGGLLLASHMIQHLLLMMAAPPLLLLGQPILPIVRALPACFVRTVFAPFLHAAGLRRWCSFLVHPVAAWLLYNAMAVGWHLPAFYDAALRNKGLHELEHLCFLVTALLFWWPVIQVWPTATRWPKAAIVGYLAAADVVNTALSAFLVFSGHALYATYRDGPRIWGFSALDDQIAAGVIMWVPGSVAYLLPAVVLAMQMLSATSPDGNASRLVRPSEFLGTAEKAAIPLKIAPVKRAKRDWDLLRLPALGGILRAPLFRRGLQVVMFALAALVMWDGWFGPPVAGLNLAGILPWIEWRGLLVIGLLVVGNVFCFACPFLLTREAGKRLFGPRRRWPKALRSKWFAAGLLTAFLVTYESFGLWSRPAWTAWIVAGYFVAAFTVDGLFEGLSFCKYVCPIGQFNFVASVVSPFEVKVKDMSICRACRTYDCIRGNQNHRGCELDLFQPLKQGSFDCTFCLDCVAACPHLNVGVLPVVPGRAVLVEQRRTSIGRLARRWDWTVLGLVFTAGAFVNAAAMTGPVGEFLMKAQSLGAMGRLGGTVALYGAGFGVTALALAVCVRLSRLGDTDFSLCLETSRKETAGSYSWALAPLGMAMWSGHSLFHLLQAGSVGTVLERLAVPHVTLSVGPDAVFSLQLVLLGVGMLMSSVLLWQKASAGPKGQRPWLETLRAWTPWAAFAAALYVAGVWVFLQPMEMRGAG